MDIETLYRIYLRHPFVTTDTRHCPKGSLFFALKGETFNGNAFAAQALKEGAEYAIIDQAEFVEPGNEHLILVNDSLQTLQQLACYHRRQSSAKIIGITGTNGKTTTKELIAAVLSENKRVLYTQGNLNNHIGVPLTLLRLTKNHDIAVIEMGANHPGEIKTLANIAEPDYGIITNVGKAHLEGFGSFEGVVRTKGELYDFLRTRKEAVIFIHQENIFLVPIAHSLNRISYGQADGLYINGRITGCNPFLTFQWKTGANGKWHYVETRLVGEYNFENALAAIAVGHYFEITEENINHALKEYVPQNNRSQLKETINNRLIIDAYNANPTSMAASLHNFRNMEASHKMVILGDMKELGKSSTEEHRKIIKILEKCEFEKVYLVGEQFVKAYEFYKTAMTDKVHPIDTSDHFDKNNHSHKSNPADSFKRSGDYKVFSDVQKLLIDLNNNKPQKMCILIKGSNSMKLIQTVEYL